MIDYEHYTRVVEGIKRMPHPSKRLQENDVNGFVEAMHVYQRQMFHENDITRRLAEASGEPIREDEQKLMDDLTKMARKANEAARIYAEAVADAERRALILLQERAKQDDDFQGFADALESGDYSELAI